jgi:NADH dehydrogenase
VGRITELVGGEELSLDHALKAIASCLGVTKPAVHIPMPLMRVAAGLLSVLPAPPVTRDQLLMLEQGSTANPAPMREIFGLEPVAFTRGIQGYLGK